MLRLINDHEKAKACSSQKKGMEKEAQAETTKTKDAITINDIRSAPRFKIKRAIRRRSLPSVMKIRFAN
jgi:hypothetical protein